MSIFLCERLPAEEPVGSRSASRHVSPRIRVSSILGFIGGALLLLWSALQLPIAIGYPAAAFLLPWYAAAFIGASLALVASRCLYLGRGSPVRNGVFLVISGIIGVVTFTAGFLETGSVITIAAGVLAITEPRVPRREGVSLAPRRTGRPIAGIILSFVGALFAGLAWYSWVTISTCGGGLSGPCFSPLTFGFFAFLFLLAGLVILALWRLRSMSPS